MTNQEDALNVVHEQAEDDGLWFIAATAPEAYLQSALRRLHAAVEAAPAPQKDAQVFDADNPRFREAFEESARANNMPVTRQGDGYRSPFTHTAFLLAYGTVNRLMLTETKP